MTTELALGIKAKAPLQAEVWWMGFTLDSDDDDAEAKFVAKHGHPPRVFLRDGAILKVGPIEEER